VSDQLALIRALGVLLTLFLSDVLYLQLQYVNHCKLRIQEFFCTKLMRDSAVMHGNAEFSFSQK
jgi:hypothetical protein